MIGKKAISPLIAAVILIAFVIAVASIASTFFTGFTKEQKAATETKGSKVIDCSNAVLNLDKDTAEEGINTTQKSFSLVVSNTGDVDLDGLRVVFYNSSYAGTCVPSPQKINVGETKTITNSSCSEMPSGSITKVQVTTTTCPGVKAEITNSSGTWKVTA